MGLHTWFYKNKELYSEYRALWERLDKHENYEIYLDDMELLQINHRIDEISDLNDAAYHDAFRTSKREKELTLNLKSGVVERINGEYTLDVIFSKKECDKWLIDNAEMVYSISTEYLDKFWNEFPNGVIDFG